MICWKFELLKVKTSNCYFWTRSKKAQTSFICNFVHIHIHKCLLNITLIFFRECLNLIPHKKFSFAKIWLLAAQFEIRQLNLKGARIILGNAIGKAPKDKVLPNSYSLVLID